MIASAHVAGLLKHENVITTDMGGTSFDVGLITEGYWRYAQEPIVERFRMLQPIIDIESIGAGGGTLAQVEAETGRLLVGPGSAGANPGPVHASGFAAELGIKMIYIFTTSPVFSAFGAAAADVIRTRVMSCQYILPADPAVINQRLDAIEEEMGAALTGEGFKRNQVEFR